MNGKNKVISTLGIALLSIVLLTASPRTVTAKERPSPRQPTRNSPSRDRDRNENRDRDRDHASSGLSISFGFGSRTSERLVPGHYETHTERVLVEPGHYERQTQRVLVEPGRYEIRHIPAVYTNARGNGREKYKTPAVAGPHARRLGKKNQVMVRPARTEKVWVPSRYEKRKVKIWVPDRYEIRQVKVWVPGHSITKPSWSPGRFWLNLGGLFRF